MFPAPTLFSCWLHGAVAARMSLKGQEGQEVWWVGEIGGHGAQGTMVAQKGIGRYSAFHMGEEWWLLFEEETQMARADVQTGGMADTA